MTTPTLEDLRRFTLHIVLVEPEIHFNTGNVGRTCRSVSHSTTRG